MHTIHSMDRKSLVIGYDMALRALGIEPARVNKFAKDWLGLWKNPVFDKREEG